MPEAPRFDLSDLELNYRPYLPADKSARILDVGCGQGRVLAFLRHEGYLNVVGVDRDASALAVAAGFGAEVHRVDDLAAFLAKKEEAFDLIIAKDVIYYFPKSAVVGTLRAFGAAMKPGGRLLVETFNGAAFAGPWVAYKDYRIEWVPTEFSLREMFLDAGFPPPDITGMRSPGATLRRILFNTVGKILKWVTKALFVAARGFDPQNPSIFDRKILVSVGHP